jgi:hypothetical protein
MTHSDKLKLKLMLYLDSQALWVEILWLAVYFNF